MQDLGNAHLVKRAECRGQLVHDGQHETAIDTHAGQACRCCTSKKVELHCHLCGH